MMHALKLILSFSLSAFFLYLAFNKIDMDGFLASLKMVSWGTLFAVSAMALMSIFIRAWRWRILLLPVKKIDYHTVLTYTMIGFMTNNVLPAHAGDFIKPYLLGVKEHISGFSALATVLVERLLDGMGLVIIFLLALPFAPLPGWLKATGLGIGIFLLSLIGILILLSSENGKPRRFILAMVEKLPDRFREHMMEKVQLFLFGLTIFQQRRQILPLLLLSVLVWAQLAITVFMVLKGYPLNIDISNWHLAIASVVTIVVLAFAVVLPSSPGYVGITQVSFIFTLAYFAVPEADAVGASVIFNLTQYIPVTVVGIIYFLKEGLSFREVRSSSRHKDRHIDVVG